MTLSMQEISDRMEISDVLAEYCRALDERRFRDLEALFSDDAVCDYGPLGQPEGPAAISRLIEAALQGLDATQHFIGGTLISVDGDTASARTYLISQHIRHAAPAETFYMIAGEYVDTLVRTPHGWKLRTRKLDRMWTMGDRAVILGRP